MSILKNNAEVSRAAMDSGIMFNADDDNDMASISMKQFKEQIGMSNEEEDSLADKSGSPEGSTVAVLQEHAACAER